MLPYYIGSSFGLYYRNTSLGEARVLTRPEFFELFKTSESWLLSIAFTCSDSLTLEDRLKLLFGLWLCQQALGSDLSCPTFLQFAKQVETQGIPDNINLYSIDTKLLAISYKILLQCGCNVPNIKSHLQYIVKEFQELQSIPARYNGEAMLLTQLFGMRCIMIEDSKLFQNNLLHFLQASETEVRSFCSELLGISGFGARKVKFPKNIAVPLRLTLTTLSISALRDYNLELGCLLLRTINSLQLGKKKILSSCIWMLINHQQSDGRFGYFASESKSLLETKLCRIATDVDRVLYLPVTVSCLWTLAEFLAPDNRVFNNRTTLSQTTYQEV